MSYVYNRQNKSHNMCYRKFAGTTPYDLSQGKPALQSLIERYLPTISKDYDTTQTQAIAYAESNYCPKSISTNLSQLSIESSKSEPGYDVRADGDSPVRSEGVVDSIYSLLWPEPKYIMELGSSVGTFVAGKELFISIIQVRFSFYLYTWVPIFYTVLF